MNELHIEKMEKTEVEAGHKWKRPVSYLLLALGALATFFSGEISRNLEIDATFVQFGALTLILIGAVLFLSVREVPNRVSAYRELLRRPDSELDTPK